MSAPSVELQAPHPGYIERRAVENLAASLTRRGFEVSVKATPTGVSYSTPWNVLLITLNHVADAAGVAAVVASAIGWAKRRWRRGNDINDTYFIQVRTANSRKVRRILIEDGEVHELKSQKEQDEAFLSSTERKHRRRLETKSPKRIREKRAVSRKQAPKKRRRDARRSTSA